MRDHVWKGLWMAAGLLLLKNTLSFAQPPTLVFGPKTYERTVGPPNRFTERFCVTNPAGPFRLIVENGQNGENRLSSAVITLNGQEVVTPEELNKKVALIEKPVTLSAENRLDVELRSGPEGFLTLWIECLGCLEVRIETPPEGSLIQADSTLVTGAIMTTSPEVGVTVNGLVAYTNGSRFAVDGLPLQPGPNTVTATATDACGLTASAIRTVQASPVEPLVILEPSPKIGPAPLTVSFSINTSLPQPIVRYEVDFDGDGFIDLTTSSRPSPQFTYTTQGLYSPAVTITTQDGTRHTATTLVNVVSLPDLQASLQAKWTAMKAALLRGDVEGALQFFEHRARE